MYTHMYVHMHADTYGTNHIKLNVLRVQNGRTRTRSVPVPTKRERPFSRRFTELDDCKKCTPT